VTTAIRVIVSPAPDVIVCDAVSDSLGEYSVLPAHVDADMDCAVWNAKPGECWHEALSASVAALRSAKDAHLFLFSVEGGVGAPDETLASTLGERLGAVAQSVLRDVPASQWVARAPIGLELDGLRARGSARVPQATGSRIAVFEFGGPTQLLKVELASVPADALVKICRATGSEAAGLLHIGAYPGISRRTGSPFVLLQCSDGAKSPLHRALALLDIEAQRYGGGVGRTTALSLLPLTELLGTLAARMPLNAVATQVIETHLNRAAG
jgi:hypothetical protein